MIVRNIRNTVVAAAVVAASCLFAPSGYSQILASSGFTYTNSFDSLGTVSNAWTDNSNLLGWYASQSIGTLNGIRAGSGTSTAGALYSFGVAGVQPVTDRALGSIASGTPGNLAYGLRLQNDTANAISNIVITYTGEQWRNGGNTATQTLAFSYTISTSPITSSDAGNSLYTWTAFPALNFNTPIVGATAAALDGHDPANSHVFTAVFLTNVVVFPGSEIFLRWYDINDSGNDHALAVDNFSVSFTNVAATVIAPSIPPNGEPLSRTNNAGTIATFTVTANGSNPTYEWQLNGMDVINGVKYSGASNPTLVVSNVLAADAGSYTVIVANSAGSVTSSIAVLTVIDPAITTPPYNQTNIVGDTANFFVGAAGTVPLSYQWLMNGAPIGSATANSLNIINAQTTDAGSYSVIVENVNSTTITSIVATLTVIVPPATNIARWDFNATNTLSSATPTPSVGTGTSSLLNHASGAFGSGGFSDPAGPPGAANSAWNTSAYPPQGTSNKTAGVEFDVSTAGYQDILIYWQQRNSDTASKYLRFQYTTDGTTYVDGPVTTMDLLNNSWQSYTVDLSSVGGVNNNPAFAFRLVTEFESTALGTTNANYDGTVSTYSTGGTMRYDLVSVYGNQFSGVTRIPLNIQQSGNNVVLTWSDSSFLLQSAPSVAGTYSNVIGASSPYTNAIGSMQFYRLHHP